MLRLFFVFCLAAGIAAPSMAFKFFEEVESVPLPEAQNLDEWFAKGAAALSLRAQAVDLNETQATREQGAQASTLRTRLGYTSAQWHYLSFGIEVDDIRALGGDEHYYNGANGQQDDLFVAAPEGTDLHAAWLMADLANTQIRYGRQRLVLDDGRLIGSSSWDQKETTVSGVTLRNATLNVTRLRAGSLHKRHTGYASAHPNHDQAMKARFAHLEYLGFIHSALSVFYLDLEGGTGRDRWDTRTIGARFAGDIDSDFYLHYLFEYARQRSASNNPLSYTSRYTAVELGGGYKGFALIAGQATLGANESGFYVSPLADVRAHQGWSNQLSGGELGNLDGGIQDRYLRFDFALQENLTLTARYHWLAPDMSVGLPEEWGEELNLGASYHYDKLQVSLYYADFHDQGLGRDAKSSWVSLGLDF